MFTMVVHHWWASLDTLQQIPAISNQGIDSLVFLDLSGGA